MNESELLLPPKAITEKQPLLLLGVFFIVGLFVGCSQSPRSSEKSVPAANRSTTTNSGSKDFSSLLDVGADSKVVNRNERLPVFRNVATETGVLFQRFSDIVPDRYYLPEIMGGGVAWFDFDVDGRLDLYAANGVPLWVGDFSPEDYLNPLFRNIGQRRFSNVVEVALADDPHYGQGCTTFDYNGDGFVDLYLTNYGRNTLLLNCGDGTFEDVTVEAGVGGQQWSTSAVSVDANRDGLPDLYIANYLDLNRSNHRTCQYVGVIGYCGPGSWEGVADELLLNQGNGQFLKSPESAQVVAENAKGLAVAAADFDDDQIPEIYVANDMVPNFLLKRKASAAEGSELYENLAVTAGCAVSSDGKNEASMGVACSDYDGDGLVDIFLTHYYESKNTLYRNLGGLLFEDASRKTKIAASSFDKLGFGTVSFDADLDGDDDIFIANGHVLGPQHSPNEMTPQLLLNDGRGIFEDVSDSVGEYFQTLLLGRGVAGGDYDNDGRIDLAVSHLDQPMALLHNETTQIRHFIGLELLTDNRVYPAGGKIVITSAGQRRTIPIVSGGSYLSANDPRIVIGLGDNDETVDVEVIWSPESSVTYPQLAVDRYWMLSEQHGKFLRVEYEAHPTE